MANQNKQKTLHDRDALNRAFQAMRRWGLIARQSFMCCRGCAGSAIATELKEKIEGGKLDPDTVKGCCTYNRQDAESRDAGKPFYLGYGPIEVHGINGSDKPVTLGGTCEEVGNTVCEILEKFGIGFEWNGDCDTRILVLPKEVG
jgi:hypothetical protein